jgi:putative PIN family toxin of toxin-antitoxin system
MKIFTDTNVLVSAFTARGLCAELFEIILADHTLMTGEFVLNELNRVLIEKLNVPESKVRQTLELLRKYYVEPTPDKPSKIKVRDIDDRWVLESAIKAKADILVTGDKDLLDISEDIQQLQIISPRGLWDLLLR